MNQDFLQLGHYAISVIGFVAGLFMLLMRSQFVARADFDGYKKSIDERFTAGSQKMAELTSVIGRVEVALGNLPTKDDLHQLALALQELRGDLKSIRTETKGLADDIERQGETLVRHEDIIAQGNRA